MKRAPVINECEPCKKGAGCLSRGELQRLHGELGAGWWIMDEHRLHKTYTFEDFQQALDFTNRVGALAERARHHPDIALSWGKVGITLYTHETGCLTAADFDLAAEIEALES